MASSPAASPAQPLGPQMWPPGESAALAAELTRHLATPPLAPLDIRISDIDGEAAAGGCVREGELQRVGPTLPPRRDATTQRPRLSADVHFRLESVPDKPAALRVSMAFPLWSALQR